MNHAVRIPLAAGLCMLASAVSAGDSSLVARFEVGFQFGSEFPGRLSTSLGTSLYAEAGDQRESGAFLPLTGVSFHAGRGVSPRVLGAAPAAHADGSDGETSWGWWAAAGAGVALAAALASSGSDEKKTVDGASDNETQCGVGDDGGLLPVIDLRCLP